MVDYFTWTAALSAPVEPATAQAVAAGEQARPLPHRPLLRSLAASRPRRRPTA